MGDVITVYDGKYLATVFIRQELCPVEAVLDVFLVIIHYGYDGGDLHVSEAFKPLYAVLDGLAAADQVIDYYEPFSIFGSVPQMNLSLLSGFSLSLQ